MIFLLFLLACEDFFGRYDPVDAAGKVYDLDRFSFYTWDGNVYWNNAANRLCMSSEGIIDTEQEQVLIPIPPSLDLATNPLTAQIEIVNKGTEGHNDRKTIYIYDKIWSNFQKLKLTRDFVGETFSDSDTYYEPEYGIKLYPDFLCDLSVSGANYSSNSNFSMYLQFNDVAAPGLLGSTSFMNGVKGTNFNSAILTAGSFTPNLPNKGENYTFSITALSEGPVTVYFDQGACKEDLSGFLNSKSNEVSMIYDSTSPTITSSTVTIQGIDSNPAVLTDMYVNVSFAQASDFYTNSDQLYYHIYYSTAITYLNTVLNTQTYADPLGTYLSYQDLYHWNYSEMPSALQLLLTPSTTIYFNVLVSDLAGNYEIFSTIPVSQTYIGP